MQVNQRCCCNVLTIIILHYVTMIVLEIHLSVFFSKIISFFALFHYFHSRSRMSYSAHYESTLLRQLRYGFAVARQVGDGDGLSVMQFCNYFEIPSGSRSG